MSNFLGLMVGVKICKCLTIYSKIYVKSRKLYRKGGTNK